PPATTSAIRATPSTSTRPWRPAPCTSASSNRADSDPAGIPPVLPGVGVLRSRGPGPVLGPGPVRRGGPVRGGAFSCGAGRGLGGVVRLLDVPQRAGLRLDLEGGQRGLRLVVRRAGG